MTTTHNHELDPVDRPDREARVDVVFTDTDGSQTATVLSVKIYASTWLSLWFAEGSEYADALRRADPSILTELFRAARNAIHKQYPRGLDLRAYFVVRIDENEAPFDSQLRLRFGPAGLEIADIRHALHLLWRRMPDAQIEEKIRLTRDIERLKARAAYLLRQPQQGEVPVYSWDASYRIAAHLADEGKD